MRRPSRFFTETAGAVVAALCVAFVLQNPVGPSYGAAASATEPAAPAIQVNRALKGDRLLIVPPAGGEPSEAQAPRNRTRALPDGCESAMGPILPDTKPSRCVT